jgi:hypothetical protein
MALTTLQNVIDRAQARHQSIDSAEALEFAEEVYREFLSKTELGRKAYDISLTAGTREYPLNAAISTIHQVDYVSASGEAKQLDHTDVNQLEAFDPGFLSKGKQSTPTHYYIEFEEDAGIKAKLNLYPIPDTTTSSGFPKITVFGTAIPTFTVATLLPERLSTPDVFVDGILAKWAKLYKDSDYQEMQARYDESMNQAIADARNFDRNMTGTYIPSFVTSLPRKR